MRTQTAQAIRDALIAELPSDVRVTLGEPAGEIEHQHVYLAAVGGAGARVEYPVVAGGPWVRDGMFTIRLVAQYAMFG